ncbi:MAG: hypothetical protein R2695_21150 [Acidimicrobiales bacterium]
MPGDPSDRRRGLVSAPCYPTGLTRSSSNGCCSSSSRSLLFLMYAVVRFVQRAMMKLALFVLLAGLGLSLWVQRDALGECARTCDCRLFGQTVDIPFDQMPEGARTRLQDGTVVCRTPNGA